MRAGTINLDHDAMMVRLSDQDQRSLAHMAADRSMTPSEWLAMARLQGRGRWNQ
jgi:hypothetical protein